MPEIKAWQTDDTLAHIEDEEETGVDWAVLNAKTQRLECQRCGVTEEMPMGLLVVQFADICGGFARRHATCQPRT